MVVIIYYKGFRLPSRIRYVDELIFKAKKKLITMLVSEGDMNEMADYINPEDKERMVRKGNIKRIVVKHEVQPYDNVEHLDVLKKQWEEEQFKIVGFGDAVIDMVKRKIKTDTDNAKDNTKIDERTEVKVRVGSSIGMINPDEC